MTMMSEKESGDPAVVGTVTDTAVAGTNSEKATEPVEGQGQDKAEEGVETESKEEVAAPVVPEKYEVPELEGFTLEGPRLEFAEKVARDAGFTQEQFAQSSKAYVELRQQEMEHVNAQWAKASEAEFGKDFATIRSDASLAVRVLAQDRPSLLDNFDKEGWSNHPDALFAFAQIGKLMRDDSMEGLDGKTSGQGQPESLANRMYPNKK